MTYSTGQLIEASDYNGFVSNNTYNVNSWWGSGSGNIGWGQTTLSTVSAGNLIYASDWASLINTIQAAANHTGTGITSRTAPTTGSLIVAMPNINTDIAAINNNRGSAAAYGTIDNSWDGNASETSNLGTSNDNWTITWTSTVTFGSADQARYFFNAGGLIRIDMSKNSSGKVKDSYWNSFVNSIGTIYIAGGIGSYQTIGGVRYTGVTVQNNTGSPTVNTGYGWYYLLNNGGTLTLFQQNQTATLYTGDYIRVQASTSSTVLTITTTWYSPGLVGYRPNGITGGTETTSPFTSFGTAPAVIVRCVTPSTSYISNTWGTPVVSEAVITATSPGPEPYYPVLSITNNFYADVVTVPGVGSGGYGPSMDPGYVIYNGNSYYMSSLLMLTTYYAASTGPGAFTSPRNCVIASIYETVLTPSLMLSAYGINPSDARSVVSSTSFSITTNVDDSAWFGYYDVTISNPPTISDITNATWHTMCYAGYPAYDRQYNQVTGFNLPIPPEGHIYILGGGDNQGTDNIRWKTIQLFVDYLILGGGGSGARGNGYEGGGGGGAGGILIDTIGISSGSYPVVVGLGGQPYPGGYPGLNSEGSGGNSSVFGITALGGGYGGGYTIYGERKVGGTGGSGGGSNGAGSGNGGGSGTPGQGHDGGPGYHYGAGGGGGGAGGNGLGGNGYGPPGPGITSSITGSPVTYATGGSGGGAYGGPYNGGEFGAPNTGNGGGGGGGFDGSGLGNGGGGGSGIVIISYDSVKQRAIGGTVTHYSGGSSGTKWVHTYTSNGTFSTTITVNYLVVGGGGGGAYATGGGGGAGGGVIEGTAIISLGDATAVVVGAGGTTTVNGNQSSFGSFVAGGGNAGGITSAYVGSDGGTSGAPQSNPGGGHYNGSYNERGGGGGGAGSAGTSANGSGGGTGGAGYTSTITGTSLTFAGGGGGAAVWGYTQGNGTDGGGNGAHTGGYFVAAGNGTTWGAGGGGGGTGSPGNLGMGASGAVVVSYDNTNQLFVGGTVTSYSGGSSGTIWVHTFTSSGYLE